MELESSGLFLEFVKRVKLVDSMLATALRHDLGYLAQFGRDATLPIVGPIYSSVHGRACVEVRTSLDPGNERAAHLRTIAYLHTDAIGFVAICGNKAGSWNDWYARAIPIADQLYLQWKEQR